MTYNNLCGDIMLICGGGACEGIKSGKLTNGLNNIAGCSLLFYNIYNYEKDCI